MRISDFFQVYRNLLKTKKFWCCVKINLRKGYHRQTKQKKIQKLFENVCLFYEINEINIKNKMKIACLKRILTLNTF